MTTIKPTSRTNTRRLNLFCQDKIQCFYIVGVLNTCALFNKFYSLTSNTELIAVPTQIKDPQKKFYSYDNLD